MYADKTLGIERDAKFSKPAELENEINSADILNMIENVEPGAEGNDQGAGKEQDYINNEYIGPESKPVIDEDMPAKKDSIRKSPIKENIERPIGAPVDEPKKKKGFFKKLFGKKEN